VNPTKEPPLVSKHYLLRVEGTIEGSQLEFIIRQDDQGLANGGEVVILLPDEGDIIPKERIRIDLIANELTRFVLMLIETGRRTDERTFSCEGTMVGDILDVASERNLKGAIFAIQHDSGSLSPIIGSLSRSKIKLDASRLSAITDALSEVPGLPSRDAVSSAQTTAAKFHAEIAMNAIESAVWAAEFVRVRHAWLPNDNAIEEGIRRANRLVGDLRRYGKAR